MNIALILAGGTGSRLGGAIPKQYMEIKGKSVIAYCAEAFEKHEMVDGIRIVADAGWHELIRRWVGGKFMGFSDPGANRQLSIWNGLQDIARDAAESDVVIIHDAARPLVSDRLIGECLNACMEHEGVMPALPVKDTVYYGLDGRIEQLLDRKLVIAGQAPEAFRLGLYLEANRRLLPDKILQINGSAEPAVMAGMDVCYIPGEERNFKITTAEDLERFQRLL